MTDKLNYHNLVDYDVADPAKLLAQRLGQATSVNMPEGFSEVVGTRGEAAYVFDMGNTCGALVQEGLGTKSLITLKIYRDSGKLYFKQLAQDAVATVINDLISVGAKPVVLNAYWSADSYNWLEDKKLSEDFIQGWKEACDLAGVVWGGGETQALSGVIHKNALELAGCGFGVIQDKNNLISERKLKENDVIVFVQSNGIHANGVSLARKISDNLADGYQTKLPSGKTYGESLVRPTHIYAKLILALQKLGIELHYLSNITGHGWRKIMRPNKNFTYEITELPATDEIFDFIQKNSKNSSEEMYGNYNMGVGYAIYVDPIDADKVIETAAEVGLKAWASGRLKKGPKQVIIKPKQIIFSAETLNLKS